MILERSSDRNRFTACLRAEVEESGQRLNSSVHEGREWASKDASACIRVQGDILCIKEALSPSEQRVCCLPKQASALQQRG
jgi:hypothetical protein